MTSRDSYTASVKTAVTTNVATNLVNELSRQEAINASGCNIGTTLQGGNSAFVTAIKNANIAAVANRLAAEQAKQAAIAVARDTLRATGDLGPV